MHRNTLRRYRHYAKTRQYVSDVSRRLKAYSFSDGFATAHELVMMMDLPDDLRKEIGITLVYSASGLVRGPDQIFKNGRLVTQKKSRKKK